jgi:hypothetical protein
MTRFIELSKVMRSDAARGSEHSDDYYRDTDEPGEGIQRPAGEPSTPVLVNVASIRSFNRRRDTRDNQPRIGCRLVFNDGGGFAVTETYDVLKGLIEGTQTA